MEAEDFKARYLTHVQSVSLVAPQELLSDLRRFVSFDPAVLEKYRVGSDEIRFLTTGGLPREAAPFLGFDAYSAAELEQMYESKFAPRSLFPLGFNGAGDPLGIELASGAIVYLNHDDGMARVFIDSSLAQFAEALVWYQELRHAQRLDTFLERIKTFDPRAADEGTMWFGEANA